MDIYAFIHKALRACMCHALTTLGSTDAADEREVGAALAEVRSLAALCESHVEHENEFVHPAMEACRPGSSAQTADDHGHHRIALKRLTTLADQVDAAAGDARAAALARLYRHLATFVGENFIHMEQEETANNQVLWSAYTDADLAAIEHAIHQTIPPQEMEAYMRWMLPALSAAERAALLTEIRDNAPAPVFDGMMQLAQQCLSARDIGKLNAALALPVEMAA